MDRDTGRRKDPSPLSDEAAARRKDASSGMDRDAGRRKDPSPLSDEAAARRKDASSGMDRDTGRRKDPSPLSDEAAARHKDASPGMDRDTGRRKDPSLLSDEAAARRKDASSGMDRDTGRRKDPSPLSDEAAARRKDASSGMDRDTGRRKDPSPLSDEAAARRKDASSGMDRDAGRRRDPSLLNDKDSSHRSLSPQGNLSYRIGNIIVYHSELDRLIITEKNNKTEGQKNKVTDQDAWLDDSVIDAFLLCAVSSASTEVSAFSTVALPTMGQTAKTKALGRQLKERYGVHESSTWLIPLNLEAYTGAAHWVLFIISHGSKRILYLDSLGSRLPPTQAVADLIALINAGHQPGSWSEWILVVPDNTLVQDDGRSCGLFVCLYADMLCNGRSYDIAADYQARRDFFDSTYRREIRLRLLKVRCRCFEGKLIKVIIDDPHG